MNKHLPVLITLLTFGSFGVVGDEVFLICVPMSQAEQSRYIEKHIIKFENPQEGMITRAKSYSLDIDLPENKFSVRGPFSYLVRESGFEKKLQFHMVNNDYQISKSEEWDLRFLDKISLLFTNLSKNYPVNPRTICSKINERTFEDELSLYKQREELQEGVERDILQIK